MRLVPPASRATSNVRYIVEYIVRNGAVLIYLDHEVRIDYLFCYTPNPQ